MRAVDGCLAEACLLDDLSDPEWVADPDPPEGLMVFYACLMDFAS
jgi:hypothetical protein